MLYLAQTGRLAGTTRDPRATIPEASASGGIRKERIMRQVFFYFLLGSLVVAVFVWALYMLGRDFGDLWKDWKLGRELDDLQAQSATRRKQRQEAGQQRLANG